MGRYDSRYKGIDDDDAGESPEYDASAAAVFGPFTSAINDYLHNDLKVEDEHVYEILTDKVQPWSFGRYSSRFPDATNTLRQSMSANPYLKLFVASGYYDLATPPATVKYSVEHMRLPPELQKNIDHKFYDGGHMMYVYEPSMEKLRKDVEAFYEKALKPEKAESGGRAVHLHLAGVAHWILKGMVVTQNSDSHLGFTCQAQPDLPLRCRTPATIAAMSSIQLQLNGSRC